MLGDSTPGRRRGERSVRAGERSARSRSLASRFCTLRVRVVGSGSAAGGPRTKGVRMDWITWRVRSGVAPPLSWPTALRAIADHEASR